MKQMNYILILLVLVSILSGVVFSKKSIPRNEKNPGIVARSRASPVDVNRVLESTNQKNIIKRNEFTENPNEELAGVPRALFPLYVSFLLDSIATGLTLPTLPFFIMELGANGMQYSLVVSLNYLAQMIGCLIMGFVSDTYGRRVVLCLCLAASSLSFYYVSKAKTILQFALAQILCSSFGGLIPVVQSSVSDVSSQADRPKYLGRIMATFGLGFVVGPALSSLFPFLNQFTLRQKLLFASILPFFGLIISLLFFKETRKNPDIHSIASTVEVEINFKKNHLKKPVSTVTINFEIIALVCNGFMLMYAFASETVYALLIKDEFGYDEKVLSKLFACSGFLIGIFQVFLIKPIITLLGKHFTLTIGNMILAFGMLGVAMVRKKVLHFSLFMVHIVGYSVADTALVSLISHYSSSSAHGRYLALNQAVQAGARVFSPLVAGLLYDISKLVAERTQNRLPVGSLPFIVGAVLPALAVAIPLIIYSRNVKQATPIQTSK
jgi:MFS family permease